MDRSQPKTFDPMFSLRVPGQHVPSYTRRPVQYARTGKSISDIRQTVVVPQTTTPIRSTPLVPQPAAAQSEAAAPKEPEERSSLKERVLQIIPNKQARLLYGMALVVFVVGVSVSVGGLKTDNRVAAQVQSKQHQTEQNVSDTVVPSTQKPSDSAVRNYMVSPNLPRYIDIPALKVHARTLSEGVTRTGELQVPWNIYDTGWYNASSQPGQNGAVLIDGHSGIGKTPGVFAKLASLTAGSQIVITRGDTQKFVYKVVKVQTLAVKDVNMSDMLVSADTSRPGLNLITCAGDVIPGTDQLNKRIEVYAVMQS